MIPGEIFPKSGFLDLNKDKKVTKLTVKNTGDRPVQVGSHFHFFESNRALTFDRKSAFAKHLNIPAGTAVRFEPGDDKEIELVDFGGKKKAFGFNGLTEGSSVSQAVSRAKKAGFIK